MKQPNPGNGLFQMSYGDWDGAAHVTCDDVCNKGTPTEKYIYDQDTDWVYVATFPNGKTTNSEVTFTTEAYP